MRHILLVLLLLSNLAVAAAAAVDWQTDYAQAVAAAQAQGKILLLDFTGSDWCGWCMRLKKEVFDTPDFEAFARENLVCVLLDYPRFRTLSLEQKKQNAGLAEKYRIQGLPAVLLLTPTEQLIGRTGYRPGGPGPYIAELRQFISPHQPAKPAAPAAAPESAPAPQ